MHAALALSLLVLAQNSAVAPGRPGVQVKPIAPQNQPFIDARGRIIQLGDEAQPLPTDAELARVDVAADLVRLARQFDAETYAERASAREQILARKPSPQELMALLLRRDLTNDARHALVSILEQRILEAPRGALGIRMDGPFMRETGVRVTGLVPGMPAERVLKVGDLIHSVDGKQLLDRSDLIRAVQALPPGLEVELAVRRTARDAEGKVLVGDDGRERVEELRIKLRLGSTDDLDDRGDPQGGGVANAMTGARLGQIEEARRRFLPIPTVVDFPDREKPAAREPANPDTLRKQLAALQLTGADPDLVRGIRERLDAVTSRLGTAPDQATRAQIEAALEAIATEIRALR
jgi:hypothetical protein